MALFFRLTADIVHTAVSKTICLYDFYTDSRVVISSFSCTPSILKKGNSISIHDKKITNGSPAMASVRYTVSNSTTKQSRAFITYFAVGISGDVRVQTVPLN